MLAAANNLAPLRRCERGNFCPLTGMISAFPAHQSISQNVCATPEETPCVTAAGADWASAAIMHEERPVWPIYPSANIGDAS